MTIVSTTVSTDEMTVGLVDASRIVAMSRFSGDPDVSNVAATARRVNVFVDRNAEQILRLEPDIVLSTRYSKTELKSLMRQAGIPYLELTEFRTLEDVEANIRALGEALGEASRAGSLIDEMKRKLRTAGAGTSAARRTWRALYLVPGELTAGTGTTMDELFRYAGLKNAAAAAGIRGHNAISMEQVLRIDPDLIVIGRGYARDANYEQRLLRERLFAPLQAIRKKRILVLPSRHILTTSQFIGDGALELSRRVNALPD
jgi:iron complex transport system substrate-binding protein